MLAAANRPSALCSGVPATLYFTCSGCEGQPFEERITRWRAGSHDEAIELAEREAHRYADEHGLSMIEFIFGMRTPLSTVSIPVSARIVSNRVGYLPSRSRMRYLTRQRRLRHP